MKTTIELIDTAEFAARWGVSRTTAFEWMKSGILVQGKHYLKIGRVIRFPWGNELIQTLISDSLEIAPSIKIGQQALKSQAPISSGAAIDLDYR